MRGWIRLIRIAVLSSKAKDCSTSLNTYQNSGRPTILDFSINYIAYGNSFWSPNRKGSKLGSPKCVFVENLTWLALPRATPKLHIRSLDSRNWSTSCYQHLSVKGRLVQEFLFQCTHSLGILESNENHVQGFRQVYGTVGTGFGGGTVQVRYRCGTGTVQVRYRYGTWVPYPYPHQNRH